MAPTAQVVAEGEYNSEWVDNLLKLRKGPDYGSILNRFAPKVVYKGFDTQKLSVTVSGIMSRASEAFMVLVLENVAEHLNRKREIRLAKVAKREQESRKEEVTVTIPEPIKKKYQCGSCRTTGGNGEWTREGIQRFKDLCKMVQEDRDSVEGKLFEQNFMKTMANKVTEESSDEEDDGAESDDDKNGDGLWTDWDGACGAVTIAAPVSATVLTAETQQPSGRAVAAAAAVAGQATAGQNDVEVLDQANGLTAI